MSQQERVGRFNRLQRSFGYAITGARDLLQAQPNLQVHLVATFLAIALAIWLRLSNTDMALIVLCAFWVLAAEGFNTAIELTIDRFGEERHPLSGAAKDMAAGAVLISAVGAALVGFLILGPPLLDRLFG